MLYTVSNTIGADKPVKEIRDANGLRWYGTMEVDSVSGRIVKFRTDAEGRALIDEEAGTMVLEEVFTATPIFVEFWRQGEVRSYRTVNYKYVLPDTEENRRMLEASRKLREEVERRDHPRNQSLPDPRADEE